MSDQTASLRIVLPAVSSLDSAAQQIDSIAAQFFGNVDYEVEYLNAEAEPAAESMSGDVVAWTFHIICTLSTVDPS